MWGKLKELKAILIYLNSGVGSIEEYDGYK
jgi:hypothetical protein